jgi:ABC-type Na+ efflux pump permease subunit
MLMRIGAIAGLAVRELFRRKDVYVALILGGALLTPLAGVNLFGVEGIVRYLREVALLLVWIFAVAVTVPTAARQVTRELERRTIYPLLAKPVSVAEFVAGAYLGAVLATGACLLLLYALFLLLCGMKEGNWWPAGIGQACLLHLAFVGLLSALAIAGALLFSPGANLTLCYLGAVGMLLVGERLGDVARDTGGAAGFTLWLLYLCLPHLEFFDLRLRVIHDWGGLPPGVVALLLAYAGLYTLCLLALATWQLRRKLR